MYIREGMLNTEWGNCSKIQTDND